MMIYNIHIYIYIYYALSLSVNALNVVLAGDGIILDGEIPPHCFGLLQS